MQIVKILPTNEKFQMPSKAHPSDAGFDLYSVEEYEFPAGGWKAIDVGFKMKLPVGFEAQVRPRSGNAVKKGLGVLNSPGTIDENYTGQVMVILVNHSKVPVKVNVGDKIAQMVVKEVPVIELEITDTLDATDRGSKGFGSSDLKS